MSDSLLTARSAGRLIPSVVSSPLGRPYRRRSTYILLSLSGASALTFFSHLLATTSTVPVYIHRRRYSHLHHHQHNHHRRQQ
jgi:hypothetical protein